MTHSQKDRDYPWVNNSNAPSLILVDKKPPTSETKTKSSKSLEYLCLFAFKCLKASRRSLDVFTAQLYFILIFKIMIALGAGD